MSVITTVEAIPSRLKMLYAYLEDKSGEDRARLTAITGPWPKAAQAGTDLTGERGGYAVSNSIAEALQLGLLVERENRVAVGRPLDRARRRSFGFDEAFAEHAEWLLLSPDSPGRESQRGFGFALSWLLMQSPRRPLDFSRNQVTLLREQLGSGDDYQITSIPRFQNLCYWARMLGYCGFVGLRGRTLVVPDPTNALRRHLREILPHKGDMRVSDVMMTLAARCPVLEDGAMRSEVEGRVLAEPRELAKLSESTSLALLRLQGQGSLELRALADAEARVLDLGDTDKRVTHLVRTRAL